MGGIGGRLGGQIGALGVVGGVVRCRVYLLFLWRGLTFDVFVCSVLWFACGCVFSCSGWAGMDIRVLLILGVAIESERSSISA